MPQKIYLAYFVELYDEFRAGIILNVLKCSQHFPIWTRDVEGDEYFMRKKRLLKLHSSPQESLKLSRYKSAGHLMS